MNRQGQDSQGWGTEGQHKTGIQVSLLEKVAPQTWRRRGPSEGTTSQSQASAAKARGHWGWSLGSPGRAAWAWPGDALGPWAALERRAPVL